MEKFLEEMYRQYSPAMLNRARRYAVCSADAEDIVSECWVRLCRHAEKLRHMPEHARTAYVMTCVHNTSVDALKRRSRGESLLLLETLAEPSNMEAQVERQAMTEQLLQALTPRQVQVVRMKLDGRPVKEIAHTLALSESCVRVHWHRALLRMQPQLMQWIHSTKAQ